MNVLNATGGGGGGWERMKGRNGRNGRQAFTFCSLSFQPLFVLWTLAEALLMELSAYAMLVWEQTIRGLLHETIERL